MRRWLILWCWASGAGVGIPARPARQATGHIHRVVGSAYLRAEPISPRREVSVFKAALHHHRPQRRQRLGHAGLYRRHRARGFPSAWAVSKDRWERTVSAEASSGPAVVPVTTAA